MAYRNPSNLAVSPSFSNSWPVMNLVEERLVEIRSDYHVFSHTVYGLRLKEVLRSAQMEVSPTTLKEKVMVVYVTQLNCRLRVPLSSLLRQLCEGWGIRLGQLAPHTFTMHQWFLRRLPCCGCGPPAWSVPSVLQVDEAIRSILFSLSPLTIRIESGILVKFGCFAECRDSWGSWKHSFFFVLRDNTWGFPCYFLASSLNEASNRATLWEGSEGQQHFVWMK